MSLPELLQVDRLTLATVRALPRSHPEAALFEPFPVHAWVIRHPDGVLLVDTGIGQGNDVVDELYQPEVTPIAEALGSFALAPEDIGGVILSHLHLDHCGQHAVCNAPVYVQAAEHDAAQAPRYTVDAWAAIPEHRLRRVAGDEEIVDGVRLLATPALNEGSVPSRACTSGRGGPRRRPGHRRRPPPLRQPAP